MRIVLATTVSALMLFGAFSADAARRPTPKERAAIARAAEVTRACASIRVSTVRHRYKWAAVRARSTRECGRAVPFPRVYRRRRGDPEARWRFVTAHPPVCGDSDGPVPPRIARDLRLGCLIPD